MEKAWRIIRYCGLGSHAGTTALLIFFATAAPAQIIARSFHGISRMLLIGAGSVYVRTDSQKSDFRVGRETSR